MTKLQEFLFGLAVISITYFGFAYPAIMETNQDMGEGLRSFLASIPYVIFCFAWLVTVVMRKEKVRS